MAASDLCTLAGVKQWLKIGGSGGEEANQNDLVLTRLIRTCSASIMAHLNRTSVLNAAYTDQIDGMDTAAIFMREWPVTAVTSVSVDNRAIQASPDNVAAGYTWDAWNAYPPGQPQAVRLIGSRFSKGRNNCRIAYVAGYLVSREAWVIPGTPYQVETDQGLGSWAADAGVVYGDTGAALALVTGTPAAGQYAIVAITPTQPLAGLYQFAAADDGRPVLISYSYVPSSLEEACINWIAERFRYRERIGMKSQSQGGQTTLSYDLSPLPPYVKTIVQPFKRVLPL